MAGRKMFTSLCRLFPPGEHGFDDQRLYLSVIAFDQANFLIDFM
jgi:hypothetical protein